MRGLATLTPVAVALCFTAFTRPAQASIHGSLGGVACPLGTTLGDGCPQNVGGTFKAVASPSLWGAYARASGQTWAAGEHPWTWNGPGIEYGIANYTPEAQLLDPKTALLPTGCTYVVGGAAGSNPNKPIHADMVECSGVNGLIFAHYNMKLHGGVKLRIDRDVSGRVQLYDLLFDIGSSMSQVTAVAKGHWGQTNTSSPTTWILDQLISGTISPGDQFQGGYLDTVETIAGAPTGNSYPITGGRCKDGANCPTGTATYTFGQAVYHPVEFQWENDNITEIDVKNVRAEGHGDVNPMTVDMFFYFGTPYATYDVEYNAVTHIPGRILNLTDWGPDYTVAHNYFEDFCYSFVDNHCEIDLQILPDGATQQHRIWSYNVVLNGKTHTVPGGTGLIWIATANSSAATWVNTQIDHNILVQNCVPNGPGNEGINPGASTCSGAGAPNVAGMSADLQEQDGTIVNETVTSNLFDWTGSLSPSHAAAGAGTVCTHPSVWTGNIDLVAGTALTGWTSKDPGLGGC